MNRSTPTEPIDAAKVNERIQQLMDSNADLMEALEAARQAISSMKVEAETAAMGDEQMLLDAAETISNDGLAAELAIRAIIAKHESQL